ncbi:MAG: gephyrin-like molybdotransferase Glp [Candidatus Heimdallarchaeota archaeon]
MEFEDVRLKGFARRITVKQAINFCMASFPVFDPVVVSLKTASVTNRILRQDIRSLRPVPPFDRSAVDGYAVRANETWGASESNPITFEIIGEVEIGTLPGVKLEPGKVIQIPTGGMVPEDADAVVMVEDTNIIASEGNKPKIIEITKAIHPRKNLARAGEDLQADHLLLLKGRKLKAVDRAFLLSAGITKIDVSPIPSIAIFSTGNELVEAWHSELPPGKVPDVNSVNLFEFCREEGWNPQIQGVIPDDKWKLKEALLKATQNFDVILLSGGSSVGKRDFTPPLLNELGKVIFHGIAMRPGGPVIAANISNKIVFGLPGFPAAALIAFRFIFRPVIFGLLGLDPSYTPITLEARITRNVGSKLGRLDFLRVILTKVDNGQLVAKPMEIGGSGLLRSIVHGNGICLIPETSEGLKEGDLVDVIVLDRDQINYSANVEEDFSL